MVVGHHLQLRSCPLLFHNFRQFNIKAGVAHHPFIQKEVDELLAKVAMEPSCDGAGFLSNGFVVPKHIVVSGPYLTLSGLISICTSLLLRFLLLDMYGNVFNMVIMLSPLISRMLIYIFLLLSIIIFYNLFGKICHISGMFDLLDWPQPPRVSLQSLHLSCSFANAMVPILLSI